jgi:hypothetical protein
MFWKKKKKQLQGPKVVGYTKTEKLEITTYLTNEPIIPAKHSIRIENIEVKNK